MTTFSHAWKHSQVTLAIPLALYGEQELLANQSATVRARTLWPSALRYSEIRKSTATSSALSESKTSIMANCALKREEEIDGNQLGVALRVQNRLQPAWYCSESNKMSWCQTVRPNGGTKWWGQMVWLQKAQPN